MSLENFNTKKEEPKLNDQEDAGPSSNIEEYYQMFDAQANEKNNYRKWYQKLLGLNEVDREEVIKERVGLYNKLLDKELTSGNAKTISEAIDHIEDRDDFKLKTSEKIEQEEFAKRKLLIIADSLEKNNFSLASEKGLALSSKVIESKKLDDSAKEAFKQKLDQLVTVKANDLILEGQYENFVKIVEELGTLKQKRTFNKEDFKNVSPELLKSAELIEVVKQTNLKEAGYGARYLMETRNRWDNLGVISKEEINSIPEIILTAKNAILKEGGYGSSYFIGKRDEWEKTGVISSSEINKLLEIIKTAKEKIIAESVYGSQYFIGKRDEWIKAGVISKEEANGMQEVIETAKSKMIKEVAYGAQYFTGEREKWIKAGVISEEDANKLPEVINVAKDKIKNEVKYGAQYFVTEKKKWVSANVLDENEINKMQEVIDTAKNKMLENLKYGKNYYQAERDKWVKAGVITTEEADQWAEKQNS